MLLIGKTANFIAYSARNFGDLETFFNWFLHFISWMSAVFLLPVYLTYRPRKYTCIDPHVDNSHQVWGWYDHPLPSWRVLSDDTLRDFVTLTFDLLTSNSCHTWRVTWPTLPQSLKPVRLCIRELTVITSFIGYHWHCVSGYCACAVSRDVCIECKFYPHI